MEVIVNFMKDNKIFITGKCHPSQPNELEEKWEQLAEKLNAEPRGANKTTKQWRTFVCEWKSRVRKKARTFQKNLTRTGGGEYIHRDLSKLENQLMGAVGWQATTGNEELLQEIDTEVPVHNFIIVQDVLRDGDKEPAAEEEAAAETEVLHLPQNVSARENRPQKRALYVSNNKAQLQKAEELHVPQNVSARGYRLQKRRKRARYVSNEARLQKSAELSSNSATELSLAVSQLSGSISTLASAINNFANALNNSRLT